MLPITYGLYIISEQFFVDYPDPNLKRAKAKGRPTCYCLPGDEPGIFWMIPLSSQTRKYIDIMHRRASQGKPNDIVHIVDLAGKSSVFVIGDIFPVTEEYISREYTIGNQHVVIVDRKDKRAIGAKAKKILELIHRGVAYCPTQADVLTIKNSLIKRLARQT